MLGDIIESMPIWFGGLFITVYWWKMLFAWFDWASWTIFRVFGFFLF